MQLPQPLSSNDSPLLNPQGIAVNLFLGELPLGLTTANGVGTSPVAVKREQISDPARVAAQHRLVYHRGLHNITAAVEVGRVVPSSNSEWLGQHRVATVRSDGEDLLIGKAGTLGQATGEDALSNPRSSRPTSLKAVKAKAIDLALTQLRQFAASSTFTEQMQTAFGSQWDAARGRSVVKALLGTNTTNPFSHVEVLPANVLKVAGAYAASNQTIYLSRSFLAENAAHPQAVAAVLLEELGHHIDTQLNATDSPG
jgi:hypothetical protein